MTGPPRRIMFVDDDPQLLSGLSKALRKYRDRWTMVFAGSGEAALGEFRRARFDVVVSDMRMPVMDGAALLASIRDEDPSTIRMILSGFADRTAIVRALPVAHQFFNKPCDLAELAAAIDRACELRARLSGDAMRAVAEQLGELPPAPVIYHELAARLASAEICVTDIAAAIERDAELCARVLQIASLPLFGGERPVRTIAEVTARVGIEMVVGLALASYTFGLAGDRPPPDLALAELQRHALQVARAARRLAACPEVAADAFIAGLVHDIGRIVIATAFPDARAEIARQLGATELTVDEVERSVLGTSHGDIGAYLLGRWGLPLPVLDAVAHQNDEAVELTARPVLAVLRAAHAAVAPGPD
jgi:HD-like signal output (HDOD) protein